MSADFIESWHAALSAADCAAIIRKFESSGQAQRGAVGAGVNIKLKDSWDICIDHMPAWANVVNALNTVMARCLMNYVKAHPYTLLAPMTLHMRERGVEQPVLLTPERIATLDPERLMALISKVFRPGTINVQKYLADQGGYPYWHCEIYPDRGGQNDSLHRVLLWSVYLNEHFDAGETEFIHQQRKITPHTGTLLMAPAGFTHTHRGNTPRGGDKYIATSWVLFQPAAKLYG